MRSESKRAGVVIAVMVLLGLGAAVGIGYCSREPSPASIPEPVLPVIKIVTHAERLWKVIKPLDGSAKPETRSDFDTLGQSLLALTNLDELRGEMVAIAAMEGEIGGINRQWPLGTGGNILPFLEYLNYAMRACTAITTASIARGDEAMAAQSLDAQMTTLPTMVERSACRREMQRLVDRLLESDATWKQQPRVVEAVKRLVDACEERAVWDFSAAVRSMKGLYVAEIRAADPVLRDSMNEEQWQTLKKNKEAVAQAVETGMEEIALAWEAENGLERIQRAVQTAYTTNPIAERFVSRGIAKLHTESRALRDSIHALKAKLESSR